MNSAVECGDIEDGVRSVYSEKRKAKTKHIIRKSLKVASVIRNIDVKIKKGNHPTIS